MLYFLVARLIWNFKPLVQLMCMDLCSVHPPHVFEIHGVSVQIRKRMRSRLNWGRPLWTQERWPFTSPTVASWWMAKWRPLGVGKAICRLWLWQGYHLPTKKKNSFGQVSACWCCLQFRVPLQPIESVAQSFLTGAVHQTPDAHPQEGEEGGEW